MKTFSPIGALIAIVIITLIGFLLIKIARKFKR